MEEYSGNFEDLYDLSYQWKNYQQEALHLRDICASFGVNNGDLLDVACGTGEHVRFLQTHFFVEGLDLNSKMIDVAARKMPNTTFHVSDMRDFSLGKKYDVVTCLFSSIAYVVSVDELYAALTCMSAHLKYGGVIIVEPHFLDPIEFGASASLITVESESTGLARATRGRFNSNRFELEFDYFVVEKQRRETFRRAEKHSLMLITKTDFFAFAESAGMSCVFLPGGLKVGKGLFVFKKDGAVE